MTGATDDVPYSVHMNEAQETVCTAIHADYMEKLSIAFVSGFIATHLLRMTAVSLARTV
jgi:hypothetical protein